MTRNQIAAKVYADKEAHPERFCPHKRCLWKTGDGSYCSRHKPAPPSIAEQMVANLNAIPEKVKPATEEDDIEQARRSR